AAAAHGLPRRPPQRRGARPVPARRPAARPRLGALPRPAGRVVVKLDLPVMENIMHITRIAGLLLLAACGGASSDPHPWDRPHQSNQGIDWRDQVIYQIMIDRFANGDPNNDFNVEPSVPGRYHDG